MISCRDLRRTRWRYQCSQALAALILLGCSEGAPLLPQPVPEASQIIAIDVTSIRKLPVARPEPDLVIGSKGNDYTFGKITAVTADGTGAVYVLDGMASEVRIFDSAGGFVRTVGRPGKGPGEFLAGGNLVVRGDTLIVQGAGVHAFTSTDEYLWSNAASDIVSAKMIGEIGDDLVLWKYEGMSSLKGADDLIFQAYAWTAPSADSARLSPLLRIVERHHYYDQQASYPVVLSNRTMVAASRSEGLYYNVGDSFHIAVKMPQGRTRRVYLASVPRVRTTRQDLDDFRRSVIARLEQRNDPRRPPRYRGNGPVARYRPVFDALVVADDGRFIVRRSDLSERPYDNISPGLFAEWQMYAVTGTPLYRLSIPSQASIEDIVGCALYSSSLDAAGNPVVERFRIPSSSCGVDP